jgi:hypothetical protein
MSDFPSWRHGPNGEARVFQSEDEVPKGWQARPFPGFPKAMAQRDSAPNALDHDDDGKAGGSISASDAAADEVKALRAEYQAKMGKKPFPGWDAAELKRRMA